jgi:uncharacterized protein YjbI with pentapeptide repeats
MDANLETKEVLAELQQSIDEGAKNAQTLLFSTLLGCVYTWLAIAATTDAGLLTNTPTSKLPFLDTSMPIVGFYWVAPFLLLLLYLYFHLQLQRLGEGLASLHDSCPDTMSVHERAYPWLLQGLVRTSAVALGDKIPSLSALQGYLSAFLAWWIVPLTLLFLWLRYLPRQDGQGTVLQVALLLGSIGAGIVFHHLAMVSQRGMNGATCWWGKVVLVILVSGVILSILSFGAIKGVPANRYSSCDPDIDAWCWPPGPALNRMDPRRLVPALFAAVDYSVFAEFQDRQVADKLPGPVENGSREPGLVTGAPLKARHLRYVMAVRANLANADLRGANLAGANLYQADLRGARFEAYQLANLDGANLYGAFLRSANLDGANLSGVELSQADLTWANLHNTFLDGAKLQKARLISADLPEARLRGTKLSEAVLVGANLKGASLQSADLGRANLQAADLSRANLSGANLRAATLTQANLTGAILADADLGGASLRLAILTGANLQGIRSSPGHGVDLQGATLTEANLIVAALRKAKLEWAELQKAKLAWADLRGAKLRGASLSQADLTEADLARSGLSRGHSAEGEARGSRTQLGQSQGR